MMNTRKLWLIGALAVLAACDPFEKENKGPLEILSAFASTGTSSDGGATAVFEGTASATTPNTYTITEVVPGTTVFFVKTNKLLDGAKIQASPVSCVPAPEVALTVNGAPANPDPANPTWFACYYPNTSTSAEGASVVIYQGANVEPLTGFFDSATLEHGFYAITATLTDKQGNTQTVTINAEVRTPAPFVEAVTPTSATVTWPVGPGATAYNVERAPNVVNADGDDEPGTFAPIATALAPTVSSFDDSGLTAETKYWYRVVAFKDTVTATSDATMILTAVTPGAPTLTAVAATATAAKHIDVTWTQVTSDVSTYIVERTTTPADAASWTAVGTEDPSTTAATLTFTDSGTTDEPLVTGTVYSYRIKASGTDWETVPGPSASVAAP